MGRFRCRAVHAVRGEIDEMIDSNIAYLDKLEAQVSALIDKGLPRSELSRIEIESCGKSRIPLGGLVRKLHQANLEYVYDQMMEQRQAEVA